MNCTRVVCVCVLSLSLLIYFLILSVLVFFFPTSLSIAHLSNSYIFLLCRIYTYIRFASINMNFRCNREKKNVCCACVCVLHFAFIRVNSCNRWPKRFCSDDIRIWCKMKINAKLTLFTELRTERTYIPRNHNIFLWLNNIKPIQRLTKRFARNHFKYRMRWKVQAWYSFFNWFSTFFLFAC